MEEINLKMANVINDSDYDQSKNQKSTKENMLIPESIEEAPSCINSVVSTENSLKKSSFKATRSLGYVSSASPGYVASAKSLMQFKCHQITPIKTCSEGTQQMSNNLGQEHPFTMTDISSNSSENTPTQVKRKVHVSWFKSSQPPKPCVAPSPTMSLVTPSRSRKQIHFGGVKMLISGLTVEFPYDSYPVQKYMINQILSAVKAAKHCLLESPTGTGKTLALLCSTLAWQQREEELIRQMKLEIHRKPDYVTPNDARKKSLPVTKNIESASIGTPCTSTNTVIELSDSDSEDIFQSPKYKKKKGNCEKTPIKINQSSTKENELDNSFNMNRDADEEKTEDNTAEMAVEPEMFRSPKIFYGTRTHKQIAQVVDQLQKTTYASKVKMTILAARDHTCVNNFVRQSTNVTEKCQALIDPIMGGGCSYYTGSTKFTSHHNLQSCGLPTVYDIEDIVNVGKRHKICPYFTLRNLVVQSDIIFCPYNYLIDPNIRESMNINVAKSIVIMDEAHNIEDTCRTAGSLWLRQMELKEAIAECQDNVKQGNNRIEYAKIEEFLIALVNWLTVSGPTFQYSGEGESILAITGKDIINWFEIDGITQDKFLELKEAVNNINQKRMEFPEENQMISGKVKQITSSIMIVLNYLFKPENVNKYQAYFFRDIGPRNRVQSTAQSSWLTNHRNNSTEREWEYNLHLMCLSPDIVFSELLNARSIILASGTLSPLETFQSELGVDFPHVVKGYHVIPRENMFVSPIANGPQRFDLKGVYNNTNKFEYQDELGKSILETVKIVPHGVLCFFPSYYLMMKLKDRWASTGLLEEMENVKESFWEPRGKQDMSRIMTDYSERIELSVENPKEEIGAILFGVFRGKIAEGIDFSDNMARAVISVGIPYMNMNSKEISLKIKYNDDTRKNLLPGYHWYRIQAYRALNQALGRCIRHDKDWGAVILMDSRLCSEDTQKNLPRWIHQEIVPFRSWECYLRNLSAFCHRMEEKDKSASNASETSCETTPNVSEK